MDEVDAAINDLRRRRKAVMDALAETTLGQSLIRIDAALAALNGQHDSGTSRSHAGRRRRSPSEGSVRDKAQKLLDEMDSAWTYDGILAEYDRRSDPIDATDPKAALRTAVWAMVKAGDAVREGDGVFRSAKWVNSAAQADFDTDDFPEDPS